MYAIRSYYELPSDTKIKKCQDAAGKWHYGDEATEECARTGVIELSPEGVKTGVIKAPPTPEEVRQREQQQTELVITSYSIHYTKLYEVRPRYSPFTQRYRALNCHTSCRFV